MDIDTDQNPSKEIQTCYTGGAAIILVALWFVLSWSPPTPPLFEASPAQIDSLLADSHWGAFTIEEKLKVLAELRTGTPYLFGCLGEGVEPDPDPVFRLDKTDCTVLVITNTALLHSESILQARRVIERVHYRDSIPSFESRYHFTSDRILSSPYYEELTHKAAPDSILTTLTVQLNRKVDGGHLLPLDWEKKVTIRYLPTCQVVPEILTRLPAACGVAFIKEANILEGYLVSHEGILLDGTHLHHASSKAGEVVETSFLDYLGTGEPEPYFDGVIFYRFR